MAEDNVTTTQTTTNADGGGQQPGDVRTYTNAEVEAIIQDRLRRQKAQFSDYADLQEKAAKFDEAQKAQMTELEQAQAKAATAEAERDAALQRANDRLIMAALTAEAAKQGFADPADAFTLADLAEVSITDDGKVVGADKAVKTLVQDKPYLVGRRTAPDLDAGAGSGGRTSGSGAIRLSVDELVMAKKMGLTAEDYAKGKASKAARQSGEDALVQIEALRAENRILRSTLEEYEE
jgi:hypothetical protein